jgi:hypothetical protein
MKKPISLLIPPLKQQFPENDNLPAYDVTSSVLLIIISKELQYVTGEPPFGQSAPRVDFICLIYPCKNYINPSRGKILWQQIPISLMLADTLSRLPPLVKEL